MLLNWIQDILRFKSKKFDMYHRLTLLGTSEEAKNHVLESVFGIKPSGIPRNGSKGCDIYEWDAQKNIKYVIYSPKWKSSYTPVQLLVPRQCMVVIVHDVSNESQNETINILRTTLFHHPWNNIYLVTVNLSKTNVVKANENFDNLKKEIENTFESDTDTLHRLCIGKLTESEKDNAREILAAYRKSKNNFQYFTLQEKNNCIRELKASLISKAENTKIGRIPSRKLGSVYDILSEKPFTEAQKMTTIVEKTVGKKFEECIKFMEACGWVFPLTKHVVTDIEQTLRILHDLPTSNFAEKAFDDLSSSEQSILGLIEVDYKKAQFYKRRGIICSKLLRFWMKTNHYFEDIEFGEESMNAVIEVVTHIHMCYQMNMKADTTLGQFFYFPCFVQLCEIPDAVDPKQPMILNRDTMSMQFKVKFRNQIPLYIHEQFCAEVNGNTLLATDWESKSWENGMYVTHGNFEYIVLRNTDTREINLCIRANHEAGALLGPMWHYFHKMKLCFDDVVKPWSDIIQTSGVVSPHCILKGIDPPHLWEFKDVFRPGESLLEIDCICGGDDTIPAAGFVKVLGVKNREKQQNAVIKYLRKQGPKGASRMEDHNENIPSTQVQTSMDITKDNKGTIHKYFNKTTTVHINHGGSCHLGDINIHAAGPESNTAAINEIRPPSLMNGIEPDSLQDWNSSNNPAFMARMEQPHVHPGQHHREVNNSFSKQPSIFNDFASGNGR